MPSAKNKIQELLQQRGLPLTLVSYTEVTPAPLGWSSRVELALPGKQPISAVGHGARKTTAEVDAAEKLIALLEGANDTDLDEAAWEAVRVEAQRGDALLKLAAYLHPTLRTAAERSAWLQSNESDSALAQVFDKWRALGDPELADYGDGLGEKAKATVVEAELWRRFQARVLAPGAVEALAALAAAVEPRAPLGGEVSTRS
jgi:hypothetical protein